MPKNISKLLMTEPQADFLADTIEEGIEAAHQLTLENTEGTEEHQYGVDRVNAPPAPRLTARHRNTCGPS